MRRLCLGSRDPQFLGPLHGLSAELALLRGPRRRRAARRWPTAWPRWRAARTPTSVVRLVWTGLMVEATAAERGRALGEPADPGAGERLLGALAGGGAHARSDG